MLYKPINGVWIINIDQSQTFFFIQILFFISFFLFTFFFLLSSFAFYLTIVFQFCKLNALWTMKWCLESWTHKIIVTHNIWIEKILNKIMKIQYRKKTQSTGGCNSYPQCFFFFNFSLSLGFFIDKKCYDDQFIVVEIDSLINQW